jgi:hypothetical protein
MNEEDEFIADAEKKDDSKKKDVAGGSKDRKDDVLKPFVAKEDYQVKQALNYLKGYRIFRAAEPLPGEKPVLKTEASPVSEK